MNIIKSLHSSLLYRCFSEKNNHFLTVSVLWGFDLNTNSAKLEQDIWQTIGNLLGKNELFDTGMPKKNAEFLVHGSCFTPKGEKTNAHNVSVTLGSLTKKLNVYGDRHWIKGLGVWALSEPELFSEMPVSYKNAFGGKNISSNPLGKGVDDIDGNLGCLQYLPNLEYPNQLIGSPSDKPSPASFNRIDLMCEQRMKYGGTYDQKYIETRMPGLPEDFDYQFFNDTPNDQQFAEYLKGGENFEIKNMHPEKSVIIGQLPDVFARVFVNHEIDNKIVFKEIPTNLDTVWFFPESELGILIHRGTIRINEDDATDIKQILIANESRSDELRSREHYQNELDLRLNPEESIKYLMHTSPLIPLGTTCGFENMSENSDFPLELLAKSNLETYGETKKNEAEKQASEQFEQLKQTMEEGSLERQKIEDIQNQLKISKSGPAEIDPDIKKIKELSDKILPSMPNDPNKPDLTKLNLKAMDDLREHMDQLQIDKKSEAKQQLNSQIVKLKQMDGGTLEQVQQLEKVLIEMELPPILPRVNVEGILLQIKEQKSELQKQLLMMQSMGLSQDQLIRIQKANENSELEKQTLAGLNIAKDSYRLGAHYIENARSPHEGRESSIRGMFINTLNSGGELTHGDYAFVDLSELNLEEVDLEGSYLEYTNLTGTNLCNVNLSNTILCNAIVKQTKFENVNFKDANLGSIKFENVQFINCDLTGATLSKSNIKNTQFNNCKMAEKQDVFLETSFEQVSFINSDMRKNVFIDLDVSRCDFSGTDLSGSNFVNPIMKNSNFKNSNLSGVNFVKATADGSCFDQSLMKNVRFVGGCSLLNTSFFLAEVAESNFRDCELYKANFNQAKLNKTDFGGANLKDSNFEKAIAVQTQFNKTDLTNSNMIKINLMEGSLYKAKISGVKFNEANLYSVNFLDCTIGQTDFTDADLEQTILKDWRPA
ncbi:DUF2169 domain-containing protein [Marinicellulosiphila megalodicopiae]|uniref:DUF2169 domain-containing protein n=1 Tax=Marinicellulosiphila megalodicopiae TaxID=2724896 RepID=UPI003BAEEE8D